MTLQSSNLKNRYIKTVTSEQIKKDLRIIEIYIEEYLKRVDYHDRTKDRIESSLMTLQ